MPEQLAIDLFTGIEDSRFPAYHQENPHIYEAFKRYALEIIRTNRKYFSAEAIINRMRWDTLVSGSDEYKINNNYKAFYSRMFMNEFPEHSGFFRVRKSKYDNH